MQLNQNTNAAQQEQLSTNGQNPTGKFVDVPVTATAGHDTVAKNQQFYNIEEKVAQLTLQLNQVFVKPYLQQALDYLKSSKLDAINSYNQLSDQVAGEIKIINQNTQIVNLRLKDAEVAINRTQEIIRNKYSNATEEEISSGQLDLEYEYNIVAEHYEATLQLSQEISNYKARVISLNSLQGLLDKAMIPFVSRLQLEIDNLELLIHNFDSTDYADIIAKKHGISTGERLLSAPKFTGRAEQLNQLTEQFNSETNASPKFEQVKRYEDVNQQQINTFANNNVNNNVANNGKGYVNSTPNNGKGYVNDSQTLATKTTATPNNVYANENVNNSVNQVNNSNANIANDNVSDDELQLSRQEQKLMRKLREQQIQMEHTIKMNKMIYEYNQSIDQMVQTQREYEQKFNNRYEDQSQSQPVIAAQTNSTPSTKAPEAASNIGTLRDHVDSVDNDRLFVVRNADQVSEEEAKQISKKFGTKSIRVVK